MASHPLRSVLAVALATGVAFAIHAPGAAAQQISSKPAASSQAFVDSIGANTHFGWLNSAYGNYSTARQKLLDLGVRWIRDGVCATCTVAQNRLNDLSKAGVRTQLLMGSPKGDMGTLPELVKAAETKLPNALGAVEGPNEWDLTGGSTWLSTLKAYQQELHTRMKASSVLRDVPVVGPSVSSKPHRQQLGDISSMLDMGNFHPYQGGLIPGLNMGEEMAISRGNSGSKPLVASEFGYHNAVGTTTMHPGTSERAAAIYVPRMFLDAFSRGVARSFAFEFLSPFSDPSGNNRDRQFGLLRNDLSAKPAYTSLRTLLSVIGDTGAKVSSPAGLRYELGGDTQDVRQVLLRRADGTAFLALWQDVSVWDRDAKLDLSPAARRVRVNFGESIVRAEVFDVSKGTTALSSRTAPTSLDLDVGPQVLVVKLTKVAGNVGLDEDGLRATYFDNADLTAPKLTRVDARIAFDWYGGAPAAGIGADTFSVRWTGKVLPRYSETYRLYVTSDDGVRVWVDGRLVLNRWVRQAATTATADVALTAGLAHDLRVEYYDGGSTASAKLEWSSARQVREVVPASALRPAAT